MYLKCLASYQFRNGYKKVQTYERDSSAGLFLIIAEDIY